MATSCEELIHWKRLWCWEGLGARGEGEDRGWDGWMASLTRWTWVWVNSGSLWWTGRPGCCDSWGCKESDTTEQLIWSDNNWHDRYYHTKWKNVRGRQIYLSYTWDLKKRYKWTYLQNRKRLQNQIYGYQRGKVCVYIYTHTNTHTYIYIIDNKDLLYSTGNYILIIL